MQNPRYSYVYSHIPAYHYECRTPSPSTRLAVSRYMLPDNSYNDQFRFDPMRVPVNPKLSPVLSQKEENTHNSSIKQITPLKQKSSTSRTRSILLLLLLFSIALSICYVSIQAQSNDLEDEMRDSRLDKIECNQPQNKSSCNSTFRYQSESIAQQKNFAIGITICLIVLSLFFVFASNQLKRKVL